MSLDVSTVVSYLSISLLTLEFVVPPGQRLEYFDAMGRRLWSLDVRTRLSCRLMSRGTVPQSGNPVQVAISGLLIIKKPEFVDTDNQRAAGGNSDSTSKQCADMVVKTFPGIHWYGRSCRKTSVVLSHQTQVQTGGHERKFSKHQAPVKWSS